MGRRFPLISDSYDVAVIGGGPAGATAAFCLAREGVRVILLEKAPLPRYKSCGGGVVRRAIRLLPFDVQAATEHNCFTAELHMLDGGLHFSAIRREPIVSMTMRDQFDLLLVSAAKKAGADVRDHCQVLDVTNRGETIELETSRGRLCARFLIAADGALSAVAKRTGWQETRHLVPALECEVAVDHDDLRRFNGTARFDFGVVPWGYAWVFPKKDHLSIGVLSMRRGTTDFQSSLTRYLTVLGIQRVRSVTRHGFVIPVSPRTDGFARKRTLLVGDVAGFADPVTGEGITFAIRSAQMAARAILEADFEEDRVIRVYRTELVKEILPELKAARWLAKFLYQSPSLRLWMFRRYGNTFTEAVTDVMAGERTYRGLIYDPRTYLRLLHSGIAKCEAAESEARA